MKLTESGQELLEELWVASEQGGQVDVAAAELSPGLAELLAQGLAERGDGLLGLSPSGRAEASRVIRRHRLAERLLADVLRTEQALLDEQACRLEHALLDGLDDSICTLLGHPQFCPHGQPIPHGECCRAMRQSVGRLIVPLNELQVGQGGSIAYLYMSNPQRAQKLMAMGVLPGVPIALKHRTPSLVFEAGFTQFAVDDEIAADIMVRLDPHAAQQEQAATPASRRRWRWPWGAARRVFKVQARIFPKNQASGY